MDAFRLLPPFLASAAGLMCLAAVSAEPPCEDNQGGAAIGRASSGQHGLCGCRYGRSCTGGTGCKFSAKQRGGWSIFGRTEREDFGPVGAEQKYRDGKLWPPYPRPSENGDCSTQFHAAHYWPHPYNCWDRSWVRDVLAIQAANGWAQATTLCCHHFDAETHCLNDSGRLHLRWIAEQVPPQHRTVYVEAGDAFVSTTRQSSVEREVAEIAGSAGMPIVVRPMSNPGRAANEVDAIRRREVETLPPPRLTLQSIGTGAGGGL